LNIVQRFRAVTGRAGRRSATRKRGAARKTFPHPTPSHTLNPAEIDPGARTPAWGQGHPSNRNPAVHRHDKPPRGAVEPPPPPHRCLTTASTIAGVKPAWLPRRPNQTMSATKCLIGPTITGWNIFRKRPHGPRILLMHAPKVGAGENFKTVGRIPTVREGETRYPSFGLTGVYRRPSLSRSDPVAPRSAIRQFWAPGE